MKPLLLLLIVLAVSTNYPRANAHQGWYAGGAHDVVVTSLTIP